MCKVLEFAQVELPEMTLQQQRGLQCGLPMTDNQKKREAEIRQSTKTRAAQVHAKEQRLKATESDCCICSSHSQVQA